MRLTYEPSSEAFHFFFKWLSPTRMLLAPQKNYSCHFGQKFMVLPSPVSHELAHAAINPVCLSVLKSIHLRFIIGDSNTPHTFIGTRSEIGFVKQLVLTQVVKMGGDETPILCKILGKSGLAFKTSWLPFCTGISTLILFSWRPQFYQGRARILDLDGWTRLA